jgi:CheY-like chemotaxis protein
MSLAPASPPHVLVVEDDRDLLRFLQEALEDEGYGVTPAASLPDALKALEEHLFHFVLTDLFYEQGKAPLQSIHPLLAEATPIPVGVMTAWQIPDTAAAQENLAFLIKKPFELDDLLRQLDAGLHPTMSNLHLNQLVEQFFLAANARDWTRLARLCAPDVMVFQPVAVASVSLGLHGYLERLEQRMNFLPGYTIVEAQMFPRRDGVAARYLANWQSRDGTVHRAGGAMRFRFRGGRIAQIEGTF